MKRFVWTAMLAACGTSTRSTPVTESAPAVAPAPAEPTSTSIALDDVTKTVVAGATTYTFRVSRTTNLAYQIDCIAALDPCSHDAYVADWADDWSDADAAAIADWMKLRRQYGGWVDSGRMQSLDPPFPIPARRRTIGVALRLTAFGARDIDDWMARLRLLLGAGEVERARTLITPFVARGDARWAARRSRLVSALEGYVELASRSDVKQLNEKIARFYAIGEQGAAQTFELVARPRHESPTTAQQLGDLGVVEVVDGEQPHDRWPVIAHEMFHAWFAASPIDSQIRLATRFAESTDPLAGPLWGLLDESLATAFGNGLVGKLVDRAAYDRDLARPRGLYNDELIDAYAKALLPAIESTLDAGGSLYDDAFVAAALAAGHQAFPQGLPPIAYLRPLGYLYHPSLKDSGQQLARASRAGSIMSTDDISEAPQVIGRPAWGTAIVWPRAKLAELAPFGSQIDYPVLRREAAKKKPFVYAKRSGGAAGVRFIFIADDDASMTALIAAFAAQPAFSFKTGIVVRLDGTR